MRIDVWSDIACPWCYIGKRRLETALADFEHGEEVEVVWHSFELDPGAPVPPTETSASALTRKYGHDGQVEAMMKQVAEVAAGEGLDYRLADTLHLNTRDGHRLLHLALDTGGPALQGTLKEALLEAYFVRAQDVTDHAVLREIAVGAGLDGARVDEVLAGDEFSAAVDRDIEGARAYGAGGVPFVVVGGRYGVSGAQPADVFLGAIRQAWALQHPQLEHIGGTAGAAAAGGAAAGAAGSGAVAEGAVCGPDGCTD